MRVAKPLSLGLALGLLGLTIAQAAFAEPPAPRGVVPAPEVARAAVTPELVVARQAALFARLKPDAARKLEAAARSYMARVDQPPTRGAPKTPLQHARDVAPALLGSLGEVDIEALAFIVMAQAAQAAEADLRAILAEMKQSQRTKEELRQFLEYRRRLRAGAKPTPPAGLDSFAEISDPEALRLQMLLDRRAKMISALSNLLQRMAETQAAITQNLK